MTGNSVFDWAGVLALLGVLGGAAKYLLNAWLDRPKATAEAGKTEAERDALDWERFQKEIARQDAKIALLEDKLLRQEAEIENLKHDRDDRDEELANERKAKQRLEAHVARLEKRLAAIESLFKTHPLTPELEAALDKLNKGEGG